jgi:hypothetical protein
MEIQASVSTPNKMLSDAKNRAAAIDAQCNFTANNYLLNRHPDFYVYIYNISEQDHVVSRPPNFDRLLIPGIRSKWNLDERGNPKPYILATRLPSPLVTPKSSTDSSEMAFDATDTRRIAMDIVNPDNWGINQDAVIDKLNVHSKHMNLAAFGVFWSLNGPGASKDQYGNATGKFEEPQTEELERANARMDAGYTALLEEARAIESSNPKDLQEKLTPAHHFAADHFGETFSWHGKRVKQENCENCGERVKSGSAFHKTEEGGMCIRNWSRAVSAGVRTKAQAYEATERPEFAPKVPVAPVAPVVAPAAPTATK